MRLRHRTMVCVGLLRCHRAVLSLSVYASLCSLCWCARASSRRPNAHAPRRACTSRGRARARAHGGDPDAVGAAWWWPAACAATSGPTRRLRLVKSAPGGSARTPQTVGVIGCLDLRLRASRSTLSIHSVGQLPGRDTLRIVLVRIVNLHVFAQSRGICTSDRGRASLDVSRNARRFFHAHNADARSSASTRATP